MANETLTQSDPGAPDPVMITIKDGEDREISAQVADDPADARRIAAIMLLQAEALPIGTVLMVSRL